MSDAKLLPRRITDGPELATRQEFIEKREALKAVREQVNQALTELEGERKFWRRTVIDPKYQMTDADMIGPDGTIERARQER